MSRTTHLPLAIAAVLGLGLGVNAVYRARPLGHPKKARTDLTVYLAGARTVLEGSDPLGVRNERGWPYVYPATLAVGLTPLTPLPLRAAAGIWYAIGLAGLVLGVLGFRRALGREGAFEWVADGLPLALVLLPSASALLRGQVGPLLLGLLGGAALCLARRRDVGAGLLISLAAALKLTPALVLVGLAAARRWRALGAGVLGLAVWLLVVPAPFLGVAGSAQSLARFGERMVVRPVRDPAAPDLTADQVHIPNNQSLTSLTIRHVEGAPRPLILVGLALGLVGVALGASGRTAAASAPPTLAAFALLLAAPLLVAPVAWHHHHVLLFPALALLAHEPTAGEKRVLGGFAALSLLHFAVGPLRPFGLLGLGTLLVFAATARRAWRERPSAAPDAASPAED